MREGGNELLAQHRKAIEARVREQIERHVRINPSGSVRRIVEMQMEQERERLERLIDESDEDAEGLMALMAWLPQLERELTRRAR